MLFFAKNKLSVLDKKITVHLSKSDWYMSNYGSTIESGLESIDENEEWVNCVREFIGVVWGEKGYRNIVEPAGLNRDDLFRIYLYMTMATMPNPIMKTGSHSMMHSLVASCIYQEEKRQLIPFINQLNSIDSNQFTETSSIEESIRNMNVNWRNAAFYTKIAIIFSIRLKSDISSALGPIYLTEAADRLTGR